MAHGKKYNNARKGSTQEPISAQEALEQVKQRAFAKFDESVDVDVNLGIDPTKGEQVVRGSVVVPHTTGKAPRIIVFAKGDHAEKAKAAGADEVGTEELIEKIQNGWMDFDYSVATPDMMGLVGKVAKKLGPRGLLPNKKLGTVTLDVAGIIQDLKKGRKFFKNDKGGVVHFSIGKVSLDPKQLQENLMAFIKALTAAKPSSSKGKYLKKMTISSTMGVGIPVNPDEFVRTA